MKLFEICRGAVRITRQKLLFIYFCICVLGKYRQFLVLVENIRQFTHQLIGNINSYSFLRSESNTTLVTTGIDFDLRARLETTLD